MVIQKELIKSLETNGEKIAIEHAQERTSYADVLQIANKIRNYLITSKLPKETIIGVQLTDRSALICSMIGILNAGCVFVLIDGSLPDNRLRTMVDDLSLLHVITFRESSSKDILGKTEGLKFHFYDDILRDHTNTHEVVLPQYDEEDSIYIYFTSGSTGTPKGVVGKNCSLAQFVHWEAKTFNITGGTRFSQFISPYFDAFLRDVFVPLLSGGTICIPAEEDDFLSDEKIVSWIDQNKINIIHCVPSLFRAINAGSITSQNLRDLRCVLLSGEKIIPAELANWYSIYSDRILLVNLYGATESTMIRTFYKISPSDIHQRTIPIGVPIDDTEILIANDDLKPCNSLVSGDLYIISNYITKGYLNDSELTHQRFIEMNVGAEKRIAYKTGDKARILSNGDIELMGRKDRQVKLRGVRVELDEIENILIQSKLVDKALVMIHGEGKNESLVAFITGTDISRDQNEGIIKVQDYLKGFLPAYMIPSRIVFIKQFPLLANGKTDYQQLLEYLTVKSTVQPQNETEEKLVAIWKDILGEKCISTEESFHSMGGNSISIMKLAGRIYKQFNVKLSLGQLFENLTIKKQGTLIDAQSSNDLFKIPKIQIKPAYNLSSSQERIYYEQELNKTSTVYNLPLAWKIKDDFDLPKIKHVLKQLILRHESLRTEFKAMNGRILQIIKDTVEFEIEEIYTQSHNIDASIIKFIRPFSLDKAPLIRCGVIITDRNEKILVVDLHHIVCDGKSHEILFSEFEHLYKGDVLVPNSINYKDYAEWEYHFRTTDEYNVQGEFWLKNFEGEIPKLELPSIDLDKSRISSEGGKVAFSIDKTELSPIIKLLDKEEITTFAGLFSIYYLFLSQLTGQEDIVIGITSSGRTQSELEKIVGMFVKTLPIPCRGNMNMTFESLVQEMNKYLIQAISHQSYDLSDIVSKLNKSRRVRVESLFQTTFSFQNFYDSLNRPENKQFSRFAFDPDTSKYPLMLVVGERENSFDFRFEYSSMFFTQGDMHILISQFVDLVKKISANLDGKILDYISTSQQGVSIQEGDITFNF